MSRKEARKQAFQTLFQLEMKDTDLTINEAINFIKDDYPDLDFDFIHWLVTGVKDHEPVLDETIEPKLKDWSIQRLLKVIVSFYVWLLLNFFIVKHLQKLLLTKLSNLLNNLVMTIIINLSTVY